MKGIRIISNLNDLPNLSSSLVRGKISHIMSKGNLTNYQDTSIIYPLVDIKPDINIEVTIQIRYNGYIYKYALSVDEVRDWLRLFSSKELYVLTTYKAFKISRPKNIISKEFESFIRILPLSDRDIEKYIQTEEWKYFPGGICLCGCGMSLLGEIEGSVSPINGICLGTINVLLRELSTNIDSYRAF